VRSARCTNHVTFPSSGSLPARGKLTPQSSSRSERGRATCATRDFPLWLPWLASRLGAAYTLAGRPAQEKTCRYLSHRSSKPLRGDGEQTALVGENRSAKVMSAMIVPLVGWESHNYRLGYAGGCFDRALPAFRRSGVGHPVGALATSIPRPHDIAMNRIAKEASSAQRQVAAP